MNVKELIDILSNEVKKCDRANAQIEIWSGEQEYEIEEMRGFSLSPDIVIILKKINTSPMKPANFKKEHKEKIKKTLKSIKEEKFPYHPPGSLP